MLGVSSGFVAYLGSVGEFLVEALLGGAGLPLGEEGRPLNGGGEEVVGVEGAFVALRAGETRGGGRGGGVSSGGGEEVGGFLLKPPMKGRGVLGTGGGSADGSTDNVGPTRTECDAGREEVTDGLIMG